MANLATSAPSGNEPQRPSGTIPSPKLRRGLKGFFNEVMREMKKVSWPSMHETNRLTGVVLLACFAMVTILTLLGYFFETIIRIITHGH